MWGRNPWDAREPGPSYRRGAEEAHTPDRPARSGDRACHPPAASDEHRRGASDLREIGHPAPRRNAGPALRRHGAAGRRDGSPAVNHLVDSASLAVRGRVHWSFRSTSRPAAPWVCPSAISPADGWPPLEPMQAHRRTSRTLRVHAIRHTRSDDHVPEVVFPLRGHPASQTLSGVDRSPEWAGSSPVGAASLIAEYPRSAHLVPGPGAPLKHAVRDSRPPRCRPLSRSEWTAIYRVRSRRCR